MATPLAAAFLILALPAAAETDASGDKPCPIYLFELQPNLPARVIPLFEPDADCKAASEMLGAFKLLRSAAGFTDKDVTLILLKDPSNNASFIPAGRNYLAVNTGYLQANKNPTSIRYMLAHEIGHAVQNSGPEMRERLALSKRLKVTDVNATGLPEADRAVWLAFNRRYEAQADGIAQQLLAAAGYPPDTQRYGNEAFFGCQNTQAAGTHPAPMQRLVNTTLGESLLSRQEAFAATSGARAFDGSSALTSAPADPMASAIPARFQPAVSLHDYDDSGRLLPGRLASADLRIPVPPPDAKPLRQVLQFAAVSTVDFWVANPYAAVVNYMTRKQVVTETVLQACGTPHAAELSREFGVWNWARRIAEAGARKMSAQLSP